MTKIRVRTSSISAADVVWWKVMHNEERDIFQKWNVCTEWNFVNWLINICQTYFSELIRLYAFLWCSRILIRICVKAWCNISKKSFCAGLTAPILLSRWRAWRYVDNPTLLIKCLHCCLDTRWNSKRSFGFSVLYWSSFLYITDFLFCSFYPNIKILSFFPLLFLVYLQ